MIFPIKFSYFINWQSKLIRRKNFRKIEINHEKTVITTDEEWLSDTTLTYTGKETMQTSTNFFTEE